MKIKIATSDFEEKFTIDSEEAHKAYYLFSHPEARGTFKNGVALTGKDIRSIKPDFNTIMGWNPTHKLTDDDWNELRKKGIDRKAYLVLEQATAVAKLADENPALLHEPLSGLLQLLPESKAPNLIAESIKKLADGFNINGP